MSQKISGHSWLIALAIVVGVASGLMAVIFYYLINLVNAGIDLLAGLGSARVVVYAMLGGSIVGPMVYFLAREAKGHGVPEVMQAVALKGGKIRPIVVVVKAVASAITIGTGGSAGREGPIVQIGAALGSTFGQWLNMSERRVKTLVACGAAAGIAATFNAPIAGAIFALEVILGEFTAGVFSLVVLASVAGAAVSRSILGSSPAFLVAQYDLVSNYEFLFYLIFGAIAMVVAQIYTKVLYKTEDIFDAIAIPEWIKPVLGGLLFGLFGLLLPESLGRGEEVMHSTLAGINPLEITPAFLAFALLALAKIVSTSLTIGSGGSGGVFFPGLFIGAMTGGAYGSVVHNLYPAITGGPGAYALVGMGAVFAGMTQAPITAILMLFEMTRDYRIILPLMLACGFASLLSGFYSKDTIYTLKLRRKGINLLAGRDANVLSSLKVGEIMATPVESVREEMTLGELIKIMQHSEHTGYPVVNKGGELVGIITLEDIRRTELPGRLEKKVKDVMVRKLILSHPEETLDKTLPKFTLQDVGRLPVVEKENPGKLLGIVTRTDIIKAYNKRLIQEEQH